MSKARSDRRPSTVEAEVYDARSRRKIRKTFATLAAAKGWRADALGALRRGAMRAPSPVTVRQAAQTWLEGARAGTIRARGGDPYKPSVLRGYSGALESRVLPELGARRLADLTRLDVQDFADSLLAEGLDPSSVRNALMPLRAICRRALSRGDLTVNPTAAIELPAVRGRRERFASADEAARLIAAVPKSDRALWATGFYAGLRRGELQALRWDDVDLAKGTLRVEQAWDEKERVYLEPRSAAGRRTVPVAPALRDHLDEHMLATGRSSGLVFEGAVDVHGPREYHHHARPLGPPATSQRQPRYWMPTSAGWPPRPIGPKSTRRRSHRTRRSIGSLRRRARPGSPRDRSRCCFA